MKVETEHVNFFFVIRLKTKVGGKDKVIKDISWKIQKWKENKGKGSNSYGAYCRVRSASLPPSQSDRACVQLIPFGSKAHQRLFTLHCPLSFLSFNGSEKLDIQPAMPTFCLSSLNEQQEEQSSSGFIKSCAKIHSLALSHRPYVQRLCHTSSVCRG